MSFFSPERGDEELNPPKVPKTDSGFGVFFPNSFFH